MKNLIHEIHRRSLWQVLGIYLAASWIVLQVVDVVGNNFGLPDWVAPAALVLLLLGFPVVLATAFVQEGMTTKEREAPEQSLADAGELPPPPAPELEKRHKVFTWKNALVGGGAAFVLLVLGTAGYLFMRSSGIGPAGTLVAQGVLDEGAEVVLANFDAADPELADVVTVSLRMDLVQSPTIDLVSQSQLAGALQRMQRDEDSPITGEVARELAEREGYGAIIEGEIGSAGSGYVLTASISGGEGFEPLAAFRVTARSDDDLIDAIEELSRDIRDKAGESLRSVARAPGLRQVSTGSLEALRIYSRGETLEGADGAGALDLFEQAVAIDPDFAMAHRKIGVQLGNQGVRRGDQIASLTRAYELRDRLPPRERYLAEAYYYSNVIGDRPRTVQSYERLLELDPRNVAGLNNLALRFMEIGRSEEAEELLVRAIAVEPFNVAFTNLADARLDLGDVAGADAALSEGVAALPGAEEALEHERVLLALTARDLDLAADLSTGFQERFSAAGGRHRWRFQNALVAASRGDLVGANRDLEGVSGGPFFFSHPMRVAEMRAGLALVRADSAEAARILLGTYEATRDSLPATDRIYEFWLPTLLEAGAAVDARRLRQEWLAEVSMDELEVFSRDQAAVLDARMIQADGDLEAAIGRWEDYGRRCGPPCRAEANVAIAKIHDGRGETDAALAAYAAYADGGPFQFRWAVDTRRLGPTLERLAELHDELGDSASAARYYERLIDLWTEADADLRPRVDDARRRLAEIRGAGQ